MRRDGVIDLPLETLARLSLIREFEERLKGLVETGVPVGPVHYYVGQEAVAESVCEALRESDWIASTHRGHAVVSNLRGRKA